MIAKKKPVGRPRRSRKVSEARLVARCAVHELEAAERCAKLQGVSVSDFIREAVKAAVTFAELRRSGYEIKATKSTREWPPSKVDF